MSRGKGPSAFVALLTSIFPSIIQVSPPTHTRAKESGIASCWLLDQPTPIVERSGAFQVIMVKLVSFPIKGMMEDCVANHTIPMYQELR